MEDRGVSPRGQAVDGDRGLPVPGFSHPAQPHSVRITGVESSEGSGLPNRADHLPDQARLAARLPRPTTQESHGSNGSCVSPRLYITQALLGYLFDLDSSNVNREINGRMLAVLSEVLPVPARDEPLLLSDPLAAQATASSSSSSGSKRRRKGKKIGTLEEM